MTEISREQPLGICFVSPKAYPLFNPDCKGLFGGAEVDLYLLGTELAKDRNFHVTFVTADYGQPEEETRGDVRIIRSLDFSQNALRGACRIWRAMKAVNADLYILKTASLGVPLAACFCRPCGRAVCYTAALTITNRTCSTFLLISANSGIGYRGTLKASNSAATRKRIYLKRSERTTKEPPNLTVQVMCVQIKLIADIYRL